MRDPFPIPVIPALSRAVQPWADRLELSTLPLHVHEVLFSALLYTFVQVVVSPWISSRWFPSYYPKTSRGKKISWDSHVVSLIQSLLINALALWVMFFDEERKNMDWEQRIWGYSGAMGLVQAFAAGYFVWDLTVSLIYIDVFGLGLLAHAVSALLVYSLGFKPFLNYYGSTFILYELSTPFLNIHWFLDKLHMTGSKAQLYNGIALIGMFFSCRLAWGTVQSGWVYYDMWRAVTRGPTVPFAAETPTNASAVAYGVEDVMYFAKDAVPIPIWLAAIYITANITLHSLNVYWFFKMISAVHKRFEPTAKEVGKKDTIAASATTAAKIGIDRLDELRKRHIPDIVPTIEDDLSDIHI